MIISITLEAKDDLSDIFIYTHLNWGLESANQYLAKIDKAVHMLLDYSESGKKKDDLFLGCRLLRSGHHLIFYHVTNDGVEIIRILHEKCQYDDYVLGD